MATNRHDDQCPARMVRSLNLSRPYPPSNATNSGTIAIKCINTSCICINNRWHISRRRILHPRQLKNGKKVKKCAIERARCASKTEQIGSKSNMNSVHMAHEALSVSQSYIQAKSAASHRAFSNFFARNGASGDAGMRPYGPRARSNTAKRRNGRRDHWPHRPNPFDSFRVPVNDHRANRENREPSKQVPCPAGGTSSNAPRTTRAHRPQMQAAHPSRR